MKKIYGRYTGGVQLAIQRKVSEKQNMAGTRTGGAGVEWRGGKVEYRRRAARETGPAGGTTAILLRFEEEIRLRVCAYRVFPLRPVATFSRSEKYIVLYNGRGGGGIVQ